jgi:AcrR family transcriptional regulator
VQYGAVTVEAIAREADLAKPSVYNAYPGLGPLLQVLLEREEARGLQALADAAPPHRGDAAEMLVLWVHSLVHAIAADPAPWRLMLIPPAETPAIVREHVQAGRDLAFQQVRSLTGALLDKRPITDPDECPPQRLITYAEDLLRALGLR